MQLLPNILNTQQGYGIKEYVNRIELFSNLNTLCWQKTVFSAIQNKGLISMRTSGHTKQSSIGPLATTIVLRIACLNHLIASMADTDEQPTLFIDGARTFCVCDIWLRYTAKVNDNRWLSSLSIKNFAFHDRKNLKRRVYRL